MPPTPPTTPEIRAAVALIHVAVRDPDSNVDPVAVANAHSTLSLASGCSEAPVAGWLIAYLDHDVWHSGPEHLAAAVDELAAHFKLPCPIRTGPLDGNQGTLF